MYCIALSDIGETQLAFAFNLAMKNLGQFLPSIEQLRGQAEQWRSPVDVTREILSRNDKPPDWEALGSRSGVSKAEIARWLEEGKQKQREHMEKLKLDPKWQAAAERAGVPEAMRLSGNRMAAVVSREPGDEA